MVGFDMEKSVRWTACGVFGVASLGRGGGIREVNSHLFFLSYFTPGYCTETTRFLKRNLRTDRDVTIYLLRRKKLSPT